jgi:hypothetical protein
MAAAPIPDGMEVLAAAGSVRTLTVEKLAVYTILGIVSLHVE